MQRFLNSRESGSIFAWEQLNVTLDVGGQNHLYPARLDVEWEVVELEPALEGVDVIPLVDQRVLRTLKHGRLLDVAQGALGKATK